MSLNKVTLIGRVGKAPEVKELQIGGLVARFSIATTETWKDKVTGEKRERTEWHNIFVYDPLAGIVKKYVTKGTLVYLEGQIQSSRYAGKDGLERTAYEIRGLSLKMLSKPEQAMQSNVYTNTAPKPIAPQNEPETYHVWSYDDVPF